MDKTLDIRLYQNEAKYFANRCEFEKAIVNYKRLIRMDPKVQDHHYWWARSLDDQEKYRLAELKFREVSVLDPKDQRVSNSLGIVFSKQGKNDEAISTFREGLKSPPKTNNLYLNLAIALTKKESYEEALEWYSKGLEMDPSDEYIHSAMGYLNFLQGKYAEAIAKFDDAIQSYQHFEMPYFNKALTFFCQGGIEKEEESKTVFELGIKNLTGAYQNRLHKLREAVRIYNNEMDRVRVGVKLDDLGVEVRANLGEIQKGLGYILSLLEIEVEKIENLLKDRWY